MQAKHKQNNRQQILIITTRQTLILPTLNERTRPEITENAYYFVELYQIGICAIFQTKIIVNKNYKVF